MRQNLNFSRLIGTVAVLMKKGDHRLPFRFCTVLTYIPEFSSYY